MKKNELPLVQERLQSLCGQPLTCAGYAADMLTLTFGPAACETCLHIQCSYRLATAETILFDRIDYFEPSDELRAGWTAAGLEEMQFPEDWPEEECRLFEQVKRLQSRLDGMVVAEAQVSRLGDLTLRFSSGETLLALPMSSRGSECWRLWNDALWPDQHMVVCGDHVELDGPGTQRRPICE